MIIELQKDDYKVNELSEIFKDVLKDVQSDFNTNPFTHYLVYTIGDKIVGYLNYYLIYNRVEIANFNVLDDYQNKGIGTSLLQYLIKKYEGKVWNITLEVRSDNKAIRLYEKMGFIKRAVRENYYKGQDGILMERRM